MELKCVWKLEFRGYGVEPHNFVSKKAAEQFAAACFYRGGRQYRIYQQRKPVNAVVYGEVEQVG